MIGSTRTFIFYKDESTVTGWNNTLFPNVAMSHVFAAHQGEQVLVIDEEHHSQPQLRLAVEGTMSPDQYKQMIRDLVNYLAFMGEPAAEKRKQIGSVVLIFLILFAFFGLGSQKRVLERDPLNLKAN